MSNVSKIKRKSVKITLGDGQEREMKITLNAMAELEERYGSVDDAFKALEKGSIKAIRCILWASLLHDTEHPVTETEVGNLIDMDNISDIMSKLSDTISEDVPTKETDNNSVDMPAGNQVPN